MKPCTIITRSSHILLLVSSVFISQIPAQALNISFDTDTLIEAEIATPDISINTTDKPDGFATDGDRFFDDNFILLGAESEDATVDSNLLFSNINSSAVTESFDLFSENPDSPIVIKFDWIFQGNGSGLLGIEPDNFTITLVNADTSNTALDLILATDYDSGSVSTVIKPGNLTAGNYTLAANLFEAGSLALGEENSAAGIGNLSVAAVPFEFSPSLGIFLVSGFFSLSYFRKKEATPSKRSVVLRFKRLVNRSIIY